MNKAENKLAIETVLTEKQKEKLFKPYPCLDLSFEEVYDLVYSSEVAILLEEQSLTTWPIAEAYGRQKAIDVYDPYIKLLVDELNELAGIAAVHGWVTHRFEQGKKCRKAIESLKQEVR